MNGTNTNQTGNKKSLALIAAFGVGGLGGITVIIARALGYLVKSAGMMPSLIVGQLLGYVCALGLLFLLGGLAAMFFDDSSARTFRSAFTLGLSVPSLFQLGALQADSAKQTADISPPFHVALVSSAFAQEVPSQRQAETTSSMLVDSPTAYRKLEVSTPKSSISENVSATFLDNSGNRISSTAVQPGFAAVDVPARATAVQFQKDGAASESHPLSETPVQTADVKIEQKPVSAFIQAIGLSREAKPSIEVAKGADAQKLPVNSYGWCYLGERRADGWSVRNVDFAGQDAPQKGTIVTVNAPLTVRPSAEGNDVTGVALAGQRLRIEEIKKRGNVYWAAVTVME